MLLYLLILFDLKGVNFLVPLFNAILNKRVLSVKYQDFKSPEAYQIIFHPYYLKQYNNRWFAFGLNDANEIPTWNLALDRIVNITETDLVYRFTYIDWFDYFYDIVGVTQPEDGVAEEIKLSFSKDVAPYVMTKPIHVSQKHLLGLHSLEVRINVIPNFELEKLILSFGEQVKVISPEDLKLRIKQRLQKSIENY